MAELELLLSGTIQFVQKSQAADNICGGSALPPCKFNSDAKHTLFEKRGSQMFYPLSIQRLSRDLSSAVYTSAQTMYKWNK